MNRQTHTSVRSIAYGRRQTLVLLAIILLALLGLGACSVPNGSAAAPTATAGAPTATSPSVAPATGDFKDGIRNVAQRVKPAVVQITNEQVQFDSFTNQPFTVPAGVGSGVIYDQQGRILTNNHVIAGAQQLTVSLPDNQKRLHGHRGRR